MWPKSGEKGEYEWMEDKGDTKGMRDLGDNKRNTVVLRIKKKGKKLNESKIQ
jgi:hypothetical protein